MTHSIIIDDSAINNDLPIVPEVIGYREIFPVTDNDLNEQINIASNLLIKEYKDKISFLSGTYAGMVDRKGCIIAIYDLPENTPVFDLPFTYNNFHVIIKYGKYDVIIEKVRQKSHDDNLAYIYQIPTVPEVKGNREAQIIEDDNLYIQVDNASIFFMYEYKHKIPLLSSAHGRMVDGKAYIIAIIDSPKCIPVCVFKMPSMYKGFYVMIDYGYFELA